jgi:dTMP kinase
MNKGRFISLEGGEACGKTTQGNLIQEYLNSKNIPYITSREPGGTPTGEMIRDILQHHASGEELSYCTEVLLFAASRAQHVDKVIKPNLEKGKWVICDRFQDSSTVYQGAGRELGAELVLKAAEISVRNNWPDITFFLDCPREISYERLHGRGQKLDTFEKEAESFHQRVYDAYKGLAQKNPDRIKSIDASKNPEEMFNQIQPYLEQLVIEYKS